MSDSEPELLLGRLAVHYELLSADQVREALRQRQATESTLSFGDYLVVSGLLDRSTLSRLRRARDEYLRRRESAARESSSASPVASAPPTIAPTAPASAAPSAAPVVSDHLLDAQVGMSLADLLVKVAAAGGSDLHLHAGSPILIRLHGQLREATSRAVSATETEQLILPFLSDSTRQRLEEELQADFAGSIPHPSGTPAKELFGDLGRYRASAYRQLRGLDAVFRLIPPGAPRLANLGLPAELTSLVEFPQGLVLLTGPAGSGKSSTLAALVRHLSEQRAEHIVTLEDPIEVLFPPSRSLVNQRQVGRDSDSFARALRAALREDPDVIVIGEMRDLETISLALTAAETGHLVLGTLHTGSAIRTINRLLGVFPPQEQPQIRSMVSESLRAVVSQRLLRRADGKGRVPALEVLLNNKAVGNLIRENKTYQIRSVMQTGGGSGMALLDASLADLVSQGIVTRDEAARHAEDPKRFEAD